MANPWEMDEKELSATEILPWELDESELTPEPFDLEKQPKFEFRGGGYSTPEEVIQRTSQMAGGTSEDTQSSGSLVSTPQSREASIKQVEEGGLGRVLTSGVETGAEFIGDLWPGGDPVKSADEYASLFGERMKVAPKDAGFVGSITRDPSFVPSMMIPFGTLARGAGGLVAKAPVIGKAVGSLFAKAPGVLQKALQAGGEGLLEEATTGVIRGDLDAGNVGLGVGASAVLGGVGSKLGEKAAEQFTRLIPNAKRRKLRKAGRMGDIKEAFEGAKGSGTFDYDLPTRLGELSEGISELGSAKRNIMEDIEKAATESGTGPGEMSLYKQLSHAQRRTGVTSSAKTKLQDALNNEVTSIQKGISSGEIDVDYAENYQVALADISNKFMRDIDPTALTPSMKNFPEGLQSSLKDLKEGIGPQNPIITSMLKAYNSRISLDKNLKRIYEKAGGGVKLTEQDDAFIKSRQLLNDHLVNLMDDAEGYLASSVPKLEAIAARPDYDEFTPAIKKMVDNAIPRQNETMKALRGLREGLIETQQLPSLYRQQEIISSIGGGDVSSTASRKLGGGDIFTSSLRALFPESGKRTYQAGLIASDPAAQRAIKEATYRNEQAPLFGSRNRR